MPFVSLIDGDVHRWYSRDAVWQSHDPRYDADAVLVLPGPAVEGVDRLDEPVAELLGRFEQAVVDHLLADGQTPTLRQRRSTAPTMPEGLAVEAHPGRTVLRAGPSAAPTALCDAVASLGGGAIAAALGNARVTVDGRSEPNPLRAMLVAAPGATLEVSLDETGPVHASWKHDGERVTLQSRPGVVTASLQLADGERLALSWWVEDRAGEPAVIADGNAGAAYRAFTHHALFGRDLEPVPLFETATSLVVADPERTAAYAAVTGAPAHRIPLDHAFSLAWEPIFRALSCDELSDGLLRLVHLEHRVVRGEGWPRHLGAQVRASDSGISAAWSSRSTSPTRARPTSCAASPGWACGPAPGSRPATPCRCARSSAGTSPAPAPPTPPAGACW